MKRLSPAILAFLVCIGHGAPLALHPENPRYFLWKGEPAVLVTSAEHYGLLPNKAFDYRRYFAELWLILSGTMRPAGAGWLRQGRDPGRGRRGGSRPSRRFVWMRS